MSAKDNKRYFWLKLHKDFFDRHDIKVIEDMPNGKEYVLFLLKLMAESVSHDGYLRFSWNIPYSPEMLASVTRTNVDIVRSALTLFRELGLVEPLDDETLFIEAVTRMTGSETGAAKRKRESRETQKRINPTEMSEIADKRGTSADNVPDCPKIVHQSKSKSKSKSIDNTSECDEIITYLNTKSGKAYRCSNSSRAPISARLAEGFTVDDCKRVVDNMAERWKGDARMDQYLRPTTLFAPQKFESYLNAAPATRTPEDDGIKPFVPGSQYAE